MEGPQERSVGCQPAWLPGHQAPASWPRRPSLDHADMRAAPRADPAPEHEPRRVERAPAAAARHARLAVAPHTGVADGAAPPPKLRARRYSDFAPSVLPKRTIRSR